MRSLDLAVLGNAIKELADGNVVAFPTETVYGLGASAFHPEAIAKVFALKGRPSDNPLIVHISNLKQLEDLVEWYPEELAKLFWPGPLTLVLPKKASVPDCVSAGLPTIGVRMPDHPLALALIEAAGPLVAPSANLSGKPSATCAEHVRHDFGDAVYVLDGGTCEVGVESTVYKVETQTILRPGAITAEMLGAVSIAQDDAERPESPGMKYRHYAPNARVRLVDAPQEGAVEGVTRENLYALLREADLRGDSEIVIVVNAQMRRDVALMNRLIRASK